LFFCNPGIFIGYFIYQSWLFWSIFFCELKLNMFFYIFVFYLVVFYIYCIICKVFLQNYKSAVFLSWQKNLYSERTCADTSNFSTEKGCWTCVQNHWRKKVHTQPFINKNLRFLRLFLPHCRQVLQVLSNHECQIFI